MTVLDRIEVRLGERSYPIVIGKGLLAQVAAHLPFTLSGRRIFILADGNVADTYARTLAGALEGAAVHIKAIQPGEASKSLAVCEDILDWLLDHGVDRTSVLFAVGGGVIGDLGGFAASLVLRGISFVQVPTTLLAQVDSSVGGKTGVNMKQGKNLVGAFYQPACVICDLDVLETLPRRELLAGYAEIVKYGLIDDAEFFIWLESHGHEVCALEPETLARAVATSCRKKAAIVAADEKEQTGARALLNLGHTFGHALEAAAGYDGRVLHGEAVAIGMVMAFRLSARLSHCPESEAARVERHLQSIGLPVRIAAIEPPLTQSAADIQALMRKDKKTARGRLTFILANGIGKAVPHNDVNDEDVRQILLHSMKGS